MLTFTEAASAVRCALELDRRATAEPRFPAVRSGIHYGTVLYRDGDYVGATVNPASRVADEAGRHPARASATRPVGPPSTSSNAAPVTLRHEHL
jgi:class 3 adenylate cyclase